MDVGHTLLGSMTSLTGMQRAFGCSRADLPFSVICHDCCLCTALASKIRPPRARATVADHGSSSYACSQSKIAQTHIQSPLYLVTCPIKACFHWYLITAIGQATTFALPACLFSADLLGDHGRIS